MTFMKRTRGLRNWISPRTSRIILCAAFILVGISQSLQGSLATIKAGQLEEPWYQNQLRSSRTQIGRFIHVRLDAPENFKRRILASSTSSNQSLAVKNNRVDPLNHFHKYKDGYDIENKHYWASTAFTGIYGYAIAAVWLLAGIICGLCGCITSCCYSNHTGQTGKQHNESVGLNLCYYASFVLVIIITSLIITGCGVHFLANHRFHTRAKRLENTIIDAANNATITIYNVTSTMIQMKTELQSYDQCITHYLNNTIQELDKDADVIKDQVQSNKGKIDTALRVLYIVVAVVGSINLAFVIIGFVCVLLRTKSSFFCMITTLYWILIVLDWIAFGLHFAINNFVDDTCLALKEYDQNPSNTTLDSILPCADLRSANNEVSKARRELHTLIVEANQNISALHEQGKTSGQNTLELIPFICNPFSGPPDYQYTGNCSSGSVRVGEVPELLEGFKCSNTSSTQKCVNQTVYNAVVAYTSAAQNMINIIPALESLTNCSFVVDTFSIIVKQQCRPLKSAARMLWITMVAISALASFLITLWLIRFRETKSGGQFGRGSIMPHDTSPPRDSDQYPNVQM